MEQWDPPRTFVAEDYGTRSMPAACTGTSLTLALESAQMDFAAYLETSTVFDLCLFAGSLSPAQITNLIASPYSPA